MKKDLPVQNLSVRLLRLINQGLPLLAFAALALFSLRSVLGAPGIIGHTWDWTIPAFPEQFWQQVQSTFWVWDNAWGPGSYSSLKPFVAFMGQFSFLILPFALLGGELYSKLVVVLLLCIAGSAMYHLAKTGLRLTTFWSVVAGVLYMFSPVTYSRLIAGHLNIVLGYALLPLLVAFCLKTVQATENKPQVSARPVVATGLALGFEQAIHPSMMVMASLVVLVLFALQITRTNARQILIAGAATFFIALLINISWILPFGIGYLTSGSLSHGYLSSSEETTITTLFANRMGLWQATSRPVLEAIRLFAPNGAGIEYVNPTSGVIAGFWTIVSLFLPIAAFALLARQKTLSRETVALGVIGIIGVTLVAGEKMLTGQWAFQILRTFAPPVWAEFGNTTRAFPLVALPYAALWALALQEFSEEIGRRSSSAMLHIAHWKFSRRALFGFLIGVIAMGAVTIWSSAFLSGGITQPISDGSEPMALKVYSLAPEDRELYDWLKNNSAGSRLTYAQPPWILWRLIVDWKTDWAWTWDIGAPTARPKFQAPAYNPEAWQAASDFNALSAYTRTGKLLGLGAVKYVVYPFHRFFRESPDLFPNASGITKQLDPVYSQKYNQRREIYDAMLAAQQDLQPLALPFAETTVFENKAYLPLIYAAPSSTLVLGSSDSLASLAQTPYFGNPPAIFFSAQQPAQNLPVLAARASRLIAEFDTAQTLEQNFNQARLPADRSDSIIHLSAPPPTPEARGTFSVPQSGAYVVRVNAYAEPSRAMDGQLGFVNTEPILDQAPTENQWTVSQLSPASELDQFKWTSNTLFAPRLSDGRLRVHTLLGESPRGDDPYVKMSKSVAPFQLRDYPTLRIVSQADDATTQLLKVSLGLDWDGDNAPDAYWTLPIAPKSSFAVTEIAALDAMTEKFPDKNDFPVVEMAVYFTQRPQTKSQNRSALYTFGLQEISLVSRVNSRTIDFFRADQAAKAVSLIEPVSIQSKSDGLALTWAASNSTGPIQLTRALEQTQFSLYAVSYQVDGPAAFVVEANLTGQDANGNKTSASFGSRYLEPYARGEPEFDARQVPPMRSARLELTITKMRGTTELRPTTLLINRSQTWHQTVTPQTQAQPDTPQLVLDDKNIALTKMTASPDRSGAWFASEPVALGQGNHSIFVSAGSTNTPYRVGIVEIAPAQQKTIQLAAPTVTFREINPTRYAVHVENATAPFYLVFSDTFHPEWQAYIIRDGATASPAAWYEQSALLSWLFEGARRNEVTRHDLVNGFANAWYMERAGSFDMVLEFVPQRLYEGGLLVSLGVFAAGIVYVLVSRDRA